MEVSCEKLNKQSRAANKWLSSSLGEGKNIFIVKKKLIFRKCHTRTRNWTSPLERKVDMRLGVVQGRFRTALGPTQPPIQWVPGALSPRVKRAGRKADHWPPSSAEAKERVKLYLHSTNTPAWRGTLLKKAQGQLKKCHTGRRNLISPLERKAGKRFGTWNIRSLYKAGSERLWGPPSLLFNGYQGLLPRG
jgi:hypothetical protein